MPFVVATLLVIADQLSKLFIIQNVPLHNEPIPLALGFHITHVRNTGAAFGLLHDLEIGPITGTMILTLFSFIVSVYIVSFIVRYRDILDPLFKVGIGLVLGGAVGNLIDRLLLGYVTDFIHFFVKSFDFAVFNIADTAVVVGVILALLSMLMPSEKT